MISLLRKTIASVERYRWLITVLLLTTYVVVYFNWWNGVPSSRTIYVRTSLPLLNWTILFATLLIPIGNWALLLRSGGKSVRWISSILLGPVALASTLLAFLTIIAIPVPVDGDLRSSIWFTHLGRVDAGAYSVAAYRANGGATTSWTTVVRQEWRPLPGLIVARNLLAESAYEAELFVTGKDEVSVMIYPYGKDAEKPRFGGRDPATTVLQLRPLR